MICAALSVFAAPASSASSASTSDATPLDHASRELRSYVPQRPLPSEKEQKPPPNPPSPPPWNSLGGAGGILRDGANRVAFQTGLQERAPFLSYGASALGSAVSAAPRNVAGGLMSGARSAIG